MALLKKIAGGIAVLSVQPEVASVGDSYFATQDKGYSPEYGVVRRISMEKYPQSAISGATRVWLYSISVGIEGHDLLSLAQEDWEQIEA